MSKLSWFNKFIYGLNILLILTTFCAYILPFLAPEIFPVLAVFTLFMPIFFFLNALFFIYWAILLKKRMILSGLMLLIGITFINKFYKFNNNQFTDSENDFTIMSYNVRLFNLFKWIPTDDIPDQITHFINDQNPDILCIQEYSNSANVDLKVYRHKYIFSSGNKIKTGQAIFSKFPIINQGPIRFDKSNNSAIFADIKKGKDIIRIYNIQLESIKISPDINEISDNIDVVNKHKSLLILERISKAFRAQQHQAQIIKNHKRDCNYPIIICGDLNNSAFSYVYRNIKGKLKDTFEENGKGFGQTYKFRYYPARIDYIFVDDNISVKSFQTFDQNELSDHYPIMSKVNLK